MIQEETMLKVADNSGERWWNASVFWEEQKRSVNIGDIIVVAVKDAEPRKKC